MSPRCVVALCFVFAGFLPGVTGAPAALGTPAITVRNNHGFGFTGAVRFDTRVPPGNYGGAAGLLVVRDGFASGTLALGPESENRFGLGENAEAAIATGPRVRASASGARLDVLVDGRAAGQMDFGLVVIPGRTASADDVPGRFALLPLAFSAQEDGSLAASAHAEGYEVRVEAIEAGGSLDFSAQVTRTHAGDAPLYLALVRRLTPPSLSGVRTRWNGRTVDGCSAPAWDREFWYTRWLDWCSWRSGDVRMAMVNGITPGYMTESQPGRWIAANHFYVWEKLREKDGSLWFISEIAGPNPEQESSRYIPLRAYVPPRQGEPLMLRWRIAAAAETPATEGMRWEDRQLLVYAGWSNSRGSAEACEYDIGVRAVSFGTSYFPYSTMTENFDYYRTSKLDRETWWPFSPALWARWRDFAPAMQTDLRIIKAMGMHWVRLHHLELLEQMPRRDALAFLDFFASECRKAGLVMFVDSAGSPEWLTEIAGRYSGIVRRVELENEVLIPGIRPGDPERWKAMYAAAKRAAPDAAVFLTGTANQPVFNTLQQLDVPFDRVGIHMYKHGPGWEECFASLALAVGGHAASLGREVTLGEFNWKGLTRLRPEERAARLRDIYSYMLQPRAISDFLQFQFQETLCVNPRLSRQGIRHYETIHLDRRPKPEAVEFMKLIRQWSPPDSPVREITISSDEVTLRNGRGRAVATLTNNTGRTLSLRFEAEAFNGIRASLGTVRSVSLEPGKSAQVPVSLALTSDRPGCFHAFLKVMYEKKSARGWIVAANPGAPEFGPPVLTERVMYEGGPDIVERIDWNSPACVTFAPDCPVLELEMAYLIRNTLQAATGREVYLCQADELPASRSRNGVIVQVASRENKMRGASPAGDLKTPVNGIIRLEKGRPERLLIGGAASEDVEAAAVDFVLRYWRNARDSSSRRVPLEKGAAFGARAAIGEVNHP